MPYFAVILPAPPPDADPEDKENVERSKILEAHADVVKFLKAHPGGRFKVFRTREDCEAYIAEQVASDHDATLVQVDEDDDDGDNVGVGENGDRQKKKTVAPSEGCAFSGLKPQELKQLKEAIQAGDEAEFHRLVDSNPRYLTSTCDTPAIIHSGTRSNALHEAAKAGNLALARAVLERVQEDVIERMYPDETSEARAKRTEYLLDLFLNMPNKGHNDTPLHAASKIGALEVVRYLAGFSSCDASRRNKMGLTPAEVACTRAASDDADVKREIEKALEEQVYIPVIRDVDLTSAGYLGSPWSPRGGQKSDLNPTGITHFLSPRPNFPSPNLSPSKSRTRSRSGNASPLTLTIAANGNEQTAVKSPLGSPLNVMALLGPLSPNDVSKVSRQWRAKTPTSLKASDPEKGVERAGREVAREIGSNLFEYWDFLGDYADFTTDEGLVLLENHLFGVHKRLEEERDAEYELDAENSPVTHIKKEPAAADPLSPMSELMLNLQSLSIKSPPALQDSNDVDLVDSDDPKTLKRQESFKSATSRLVSREDNESEDDDLESNASFRTAMEGVSTYISGSEPSESDLRVYEALKHAGDLERMRSKFPYVAEWLETVSLASEEQRESWKRSKQRKNWMRRGKDVIRVPKLNLDLCAE